MSARRRRRHAEAHEHENHERWLVSYADFITLLFAFFAVLYATSQQDAAKEKKFEESIRKTFAYVAVFGGSGSGSGSGTGRASSETPQEALAAAMADAFPGRGAGAAEVRDYVERRARRELGDEAYEGAVEGVKHDALGVRIQLAASALFPPGSADLKPESYRALEKIGRMLKESGRKVIVEGHTDDEPIRTARFPSNWELSAARATKVVRYLSQIHGVEGGRLAAVAYADKKPIAPNDGESNRARNRRIEILIEVGDRAE